MTKPVPIRARAPERSTVVRDAEVLARVAEGDVAALGALYDRYARSVFKFAHHAAPHDDAEDIVQTTFLRVLRIAGTFHPSAESARPWLFAIAARVIQGRRRSLMRLGNAMRGLRRVARGELTSHDEERTDLERGTSRLSEQKRVVFLLSQLEGFTAEQIASMLDIPVGTVWTRLHHARRELRAFLESEEGP
jgi:RNA polymerase sigma factor (sigma-70 family)